MIDFQVTTGPCLVGPPSHIFSSRESRLLISRMTDLLINLHDKIIPKSKLISSGFNITLPHFEHLNMASCLSHKSQAVIFKLLDSLKNLHQFFLLSPFVALSCLFRFSVSKSDFQVCSASPKVLSHKLLHTFFSSNCQLIVKLLSSTTPDFKFPDKSGPWVQQGIQQLLLL